jgi:hypothetical protein
MEMGLSAGQRRVLQGMLREIRSYRTGQTAFPKLVRDLEGLMDAGEFKNAAFVNAWYDHWTPLEVRSALDGDRVDVAALLPELDRMAQFIERTLPDGWSEI